MNFSVWLEKNEKDIDKGAGIFFTDGSCFLAIKNPTDYKEGTWTLPGGHMKESETPLKAAKRESKEEVGTVKGKMFGLISDFDQKWNTFLFLIEKPFEVKLSDEHVDDAWVDFDKIDKYNWYKKVKELLPQYINKTKKHLEINETGDLNGWAPTEGEPKTMDQEKLEVPESPHVDELFGNGIHIWLDDERDPQNEFIQNNFGSKGNEIWVQTPKEAIDLIKKHKVKSISLDHDLGEDVGTGYDVAKWIEKAVFEKKISPIPEMKVHSANSVGAQKMQQALNNAKRYWSK